MPSNANTPTWDRGAAEKASENDFGANIPHYNTQKLGENQLDARRCVDETWQDVQASLGVHLAVPTAQTRLIRHLKYLKCSHVYLGAS